MRVFGLLTLHLGPLVNCLGKNKQDSKVENVKQGWALQE